MSNSIVLQINPLSLRDRLRSRSVTRWHTVQVNIKQNIAEHSHCVGIIAEHLLERLISNASLEERFAVLKYAQVHDLPEIITGDPSSVFKRFLKNNLSGFEPLMDALEHQLVPELGMLDELFKKYPHLPIICKAADLLEALSYFLVAKGLDEQHNAVVLKKLTQYIDQCVTKGFDALPALKWTEILAVKQDIEGSGSTVIDLEGI